MHIFGDQMKSKSALEFGRLGLVNLFDTVNFFFSPYSYFSFEYKHMFVVIECRLTVIRIGDVLFLLLNK